MDSDLRREIILDNYQEPMNRGLIDNDNYVKTRSSSESCIDDLSFMMLIDDDIIKDIRFDGEACAICTSATSIMIKTLIGKTKEQALAIVTNFEKMVNEEPFDHEALEELIVYDEIYKQPSRKRCALLPFEGIKKVLSS